MRAHWLLVTLVTLAALAGSVAWLAQRDRVYEAKAEILVTPLPDVGDSAVVGLQLLRESSDPTRVIQTAAGLIDSQQASVAAARRMGRGWTAGRVRAGTDVQPQGQSNILDVTGHGANPREATKLANVFASAALNARRTTVARQVDAAIAQLELRQRTATSTAERTQIAQTLSELQSLRSTGDPTLSSAQQAGTASAIGAPGWLVVLVSLLAGFTLASAASMLIELLDRRVRDEEDLIGRYPLPVLARVPPLPRKLRRAEVVSPVAMPQSVREAFRTIQIQIERGARGRVIMVTSASTGDGKTITAVNLAFALARTGQRVILLDLDLRKRDISRHLSVEGAPGLVSMLSGRRHLSELLVPAPELPSLHVVPAGAGNMVLFEAVARKLPEILAEARELADYVVLDTAPLGEVSDALAMTDDVDEIVLVGRPGHTNRASFDHVHDLLERSGNTPFGIIIAGQPPLAGVSYRPYGYTEEESPNGKAPHDLGLAGTRSP